MARRHRHHRKLQATAPIATPVPAEVGSMSAIISSDYDAIRTDLRKTVLVTARLLLALGLLAYWQSQTQWVVPLGSTLYNVLHIR